MDDSNLWLLPHQGRAGASGPTRDRPAETGRNRPLSDDARRSVRYQDRSGVFGRSTRGLRGQFSGTFARRREYPQRV